MANFLTTRKELMGEIEAKDARIADLESQLEASLARATDAEARLQEAADRVLATDENMTAITAERDTLAARCLELEKANAELTERAEVTEEKISLAASRMLAATGHPPVDLEGPADDAKPDLIQQLSALHGAERTKFYRENRKDILAALRKG